VSATYKSDYEPWEVASAILVSVCIQVGAGIMLYVTSDSVYLAPEIEKPVGETPVKVTPVLDLDSPLLKLGGKKPKLPDMWNAPPRPKPAAAPKTDKAFVSTKASEKPEDAPKKDQPVAEASVEPPKDLPDAGTPENPTESPTDPDSSANPIETSNLPPGVTQEGSPDGVRDGTEVDPTKVNASRMYQARLVSYFNRFAAGKCAGAEGTSTSATVRLSGLTVASISVAPSGNAAFDASIPPAMQGAVGTSVPPPPENFPEFLKPSFGITIVCR
jgi:hypothetical protein